MPCGNPHLSNQANHMLTCVMILHSLNWPTIHCHVTISQNEIITLIFLLSHHHHAGSRHHAGSHHRFAAEAPSTTYILLVDTYRVPLPHLSLPPWRTCSNTTIFFATNHHHHHQPQHRTAIEASLRRTCNHVRNSYSNEICTMLRRRHPPERQPRRSSHHLPFSTTVDHEHTYHKTWQPLHTQAHKLWNMAVATHASTHHRSAAETQPPRLAS